MIFLGYPKKLGAFAKNQRRYRKKHSTFAPIKSTKRMKLFKTILFIALVYSVGVASVVHAQQRDRYEFMRNLPVYADSLIADFDFPLAWQNAGISDFEAWRMVARQKVLDCMLMPPPAPPVGYEGQFFGDYLAKHGYVVFSADAPMWGERGQKEGPLRERYDIIAGNMMMYGIDLCAWMTYDDMAGTEFLASMSEVDASRIGCTGWSMGGYRAWMLSALSDHIKVGTAVCWLTTTDEQLSFKYKRTENGGFANCLPGLRRWLDYPHVASIACPKPMLFINGSQDKLFPVAGVEKAFATMHETWKSQGADELLETELWEMPHSCPKRAQKRVLEFFKKYL